MELADEHFRLLVESVADYAIFLLDPEGRVQSWNAGAERLKGYRADEIVGESFARFFPTEARAAGKPQALLATALRDGRIEDVGWRLRKDGTQFWASAVITTLRDHAGTHIGFAKVTRDLTDRVYRTFVEASHAIVWTTDATGRPNADSPSWRAFSGQSEAAWRAGSGWDAVHPDDVERFRAARTRAQATGQAYDVEYRLRRHDGVFVWTEGRAIPLRDDRGEVHEWFGVALDISARKQAELATQRALELWTTTLRSIGDAVISTDAQGRVRFVNPVAERLTGWTATEALGRPLVEVFPIFNEETGVVVENPVDKVLRHGKIVGLANHTVLRKRDGRELPIDDSAAPIRDPDGAIEGVVLVFRDASAQKRELYRRTFLARATEELFAAHDYRDALARIAQLAVPRLADWATVSIADANGGRPEQLALAHVDPAKIAYAQALAQRYPVDPNAATGIPNVLRTGKSEVYLEISDAMLDAAARDPEHRRMLHELDLRSAILVPLHGTGGVFGALSFILTGARRYDARDLELAEELARRAALIIERRRSEEEAERANRMKDEFLATISHELRTPLQAILGYASMLERGIAKDPAKAIATIVRNANAQTRLVEDILDVSRIQSGKLRIASGRVDVAVVIRQALDTIRPTVQARQLHIVETIAPDLGEIDGDAERLQQVVWNLLSNAAKFTPAGGEISIHAERRDGLVRLVVRDSGKGIPPDHLATIFERFRQIDSSTTRQQGGLGLGLAIVRYLVEAHGGTVQADSDGMGHGATFTVTLPIDGVLPVAREPKRESRPALALPLRGIRVLVVDDDDDARDLIADALAGAGAIVAQAHSAGECFAMIQVDPPHVLVSDIGMPGEDGYAMLRRIRALPPERGGDVPAVALTAYARAEDERAAEQAGFQLHIVKPVTLDALISAVRQCTGGF